MSRVSPVQPALRNCASDEGRSFEVGNQVLISSRRKLLTGWACNNRELPRSSRFRLRKIRRLKLKKKSAKVINMK